MFDIYLRHLKDFIADPISRALANLKGFGVTPNHFTAVSGIFGLLSVYISAMQPERTGLALILFMLNRAFDCLDGAYARMTNQSSDFGGYFDIIVDFTIYGLVPVAVSAGNPDNTAFAMMGLLEVTFFVNAAGLFFLSALIDKNKAA